MIDKGLYNRFYFEYFAEQQNLEHRPEGLEKCTTGELLGELEDIVQVLGLCKTADLANFWSTDPGVVFMRIKKELYNRLENKR